MVVISKARILLEYNSRGSETLGVILESNKGFKASFAAPAGASVGIREVPMYPPGGINEAIRVFNEYLAPRLIGFKYESQSELDEYIRDLDGTGRYEKLGSAISLSVSVAGAELASREYNIPLFYWLSNGDTRCLPLPLGNVIGGGKHARGRSIDIQEILVFPCEADSYKTAFKMITEVHKRVADVLAKRDKGFTGGKNDEGAWTTTLNDEDAIEIIREVSDEVSSEYGYRLHIGIDVAASSMWDGNILKYKYYRGARYLDPEEQYNYIIELIKKYDLKYIEDPFYEEDYNSFAKLTREVGNGRFIVGDDLYVTNKTRIALGVNLRAGNGVIIKPNQVGDLTAAKEAVKEARRGGFLIVVSHRSGETPYSHLAHIAVGFSSDLFKCGIAGGERVIKHNELIKIEELYGGFSIARIVV